MLDVSPKTKSVTYDRSVTASLKGSVTNVPGSVGNVVGIQLLLYTYSQLDVDCFSYRR